MKQIFWGLAVWVCATTAEAKSLVRPVDITYAMPDAIDHVAEMEIVADGDTLQRVVVSRSGDWVRETRPASARNLAKDEIVTANLKTGESWQYGRTTEGRYAYLTFQSLRSDARGTLSRTGRTETVLSETCRVWRFVRQKRTETFCQTHDGAILWHNLTDDGWTVRARTVRVERRSPPLTEVAVPADLFLLSNWGNWSATPSSDPNHEVTLEQTYILDKTTTRWTSTVRRLGNLQVENRIDTDGTTLRTYKGDSGRIEIRQDARGIYELSIDANTQFILPKGLVGEKDTQQTVLGETCTRLGSDYEHGNYRQCLTHDGAVLETFSYNYFPRAETLTTKAISFRRGHLRPEDVMPPADLLK